MLWQRNLCNRVQNHPNLILQYILSVIKLLNPYPPNKKTPENTIKEKRQNIREKKLVLFSLLLPAKIRIQLIIISITVKKFSGSSFSNVRLCCFLTCHLSLSFFPFLFFFLDCYAMNKCQLELFFCVLFVTLWLILKIKNI